jgi:hypothetical protein
LFVLAIGCVVVYIRQRRAKTLKPEIGIALLAVAVFLGGTVLIAGISAVPDVLRPPAVDRGRVMRVYDKLVDPENDVIDTRVELSNGAVLSLPDALKTTLQPGSCVELTTTPATRFVLVAKQLAPDACLVTQ